MHTFKTGEVVRIADNCTDTWVSQGLLSRTRLAIVLDDCPISTPGQEGRLPLCYIYEDGSRVCSGLCLPEFLLSGADDPIAVAAKAAYEQQMAKEAAYKEQLTKERADIAREYGLDPEVADQFYQARRSWEYDHGDDG